MIFQDPMTSFEPDMTIGRRSRAVRIHKKVSKHELPTGHRGPPARACRGPPSVSRPTLTSCPVGFASAS